LGRVATFPSQFLLDPFIRQWLHEDLGRGDRITDAILGNQSRIGTAQLYLKQNGIVAGLPLLYAVFSTLDPQVQVMLRASEGMVASGGTALGGTMVAELTGSLSALLMGERVALNLIMRLSGIATLTRRYTDSIADLPTRLVDTRKTTPGLRLLEKYATALGGAQNHRFGLDDAVMIKDNHIAAAGGIGVAITQVRAVMPFPLAIEVETETLAQVAEAITQQADIIMLDNMPVELMRTAVQIIRAQAPGIKIEASGNVTLQNLREIAQTGVDYISTSATITQASWLDYSLRIQQAS
jgi:nicotinate-nucleotide pyrophosphorylase (carboxylating)